MAYISRSQSGIREVKAVAQRKNMKASLIAVLYSITSDQGADFTAKEVQQDPGKTLLVSFFPMLAVTQQSLIQFRTSHLGILGTNGVGPSVSINNQDTPAP